MSRLFRNSYPATMSRQSLGKLKVSVTSDNDAKPVEGATVQIKTSTTDTKTIETLTTDASGQTPTIEVPTPPIDLSLEPQDKIMPYAEYTIETTSDQTQPSVIEGCQVLADTTALQSVAATPAEGARDVSVIFIPEHTLYGEYPPKIPEAAIKPLPTASSGFVVLDEVVVPEIVVVHDGDPSDPTAKNYFVPFKRYIKNVASSEIYPTWPIQSITANVLAILSFTLNRVFTEWYRAKGKDFTITSSTAYDHKWMPGRNIFGNISRLVDDIFTNYVAKPGFTQPLFTQYCDGLRVQCPNWMTQWGSKAQADQGASAIEILRNAYGQDIYIDQAKRVSGIPSSFGGTNLQVGSSGKDVRTIQQQLNDISDNYPAIPKVRVDGVFGEGTKAAVQKFQEVFNLPATGIVDYPTWYRISDIFVAVERLAELN